MKKIESTKLNTGNDVIILDDPYTNWTSVCANNWIEKTILKRKTDKYDQTIIIYTGSFKV